MEKNEYFYEIEKIYKEKKDDLLKRLNEFKDTWKNGSNKDIHVELSFCILTPQSKAFNAWKAITQLRDNNLLFEGTAEDMVDYLNIVRFKNNKAKYLVELREQMKNELCRVFWARRHAEQTHVIIHVSMVRKTSPSHLSISSPALTYCIMSVAELQTLKIGHMSSY